MASPAVVGALRIDLGASTASFDAGMSRAQAGLQQFSASAAKAGAAVTKLAQDAQRAAAMTAMHARQLNYQLVDIAQGIPLLLQSPIYGLQNLGFQFAQIGQMYYGQGGLGAAFRDMGKALGGIATRFWPVAAVVGVVATGFAALTTTINKTARTQVSMSDVMLASWQLLSERVGAALKPVTDWLGNLWDYIAPGITNAIEGIIDSFDLGFRDVVTIWNYLPSALGELVVNAANGVLDGIEDMINGAIGRMNVFILQVKQQLGGLAAGLGTLSAVDLGNVPNPWGGANDRMQLQFALNRKAVMSTSAVAAISERAQKLASSSTDDTTKSAERGTKALRDMADTGFGYLAEQANAFADAAGSAFSNMGSLFADAFRKGGNVIENVFNGLLDKVGQFGESLANTGFNQLLNIGIGALFGTGATGGTWGNGLWGTAIFGHNAGGTSNWPGGLSWVGERGPELVNLPSGSRVYSHEQSRAMAAGPTMTFNITGSRQDAAAIANLARQEATKVFLQFQKNPYRRA